MEYVLLIISAIICYLLSALIHELGHIICGLLNHWKLFMLVVGPIKFYRDTINSKIKIGIEKNVILWSGVGGTFPVKRSKDNINVWSKILLSGPLTSIIFRYDNDSLIDCHKECYCTYAMLNAYCHGSYVYNSYENENRFII